MMRATKSFQHQSIDDALAALAASMQAAHLSTDVSIAAAIERLKTGIAAARFHVMRPVDAKPKLLAVIGGTGTGKSTLVNRLLGAELSAASYRRTFTAGPVAIVHNGATLPENWLGIAHHSTEQLPSRGEIDALCVVTHDNDALRDIALIDTPDLDGDQPLHHAQADRVFRWADAVLFLVTPEKYQMTELPPYYRLTARYALPAMFAMNKVDDRSPPEDFAKQFATAGPLFVLPRDDSAFVAEPSLNIDALREAIIRLALNTDADGLRNRVDDLLGRCRDQVIAPLRRERAIADALIRSLRAMESPSAEIDVNPITAQLRRRMQQRSVLYLMGPGRILDRVRQMPGLLARLPRSAWDLMRGGTRANSADSPAAVRDADKLDFHATLVDQFRIIQAKIDDQLRAQPTASSWTQNDAAFQSEVLFSPDRAGAIADDELAKLREWLEKKWNATPRDTAILMKLIRHLPGGEKLAAWSEAAPYLLAVVVAAHGAIFGHVDLLILGGYSLATWLSERVSNEVSSRVRGTNNTITQRFTDLAHEQIRRVAQWLDSRVASTAAIDRIEKLADTLSERLERGE